MEQDIIAEYQKQPGHDVIIADEAQFFTPAQIDQLRQLVDEEDIPVLCFGLRTDFLTHFFPGAQRLMELADSLTEIKTVCACGRKATVNARIDENGRVITHGVQVGCHENAAWKLLSDCFEKLFPVTDEGAVHGDNTNVFCHFYSFPYSRVNVS